MLIRELIEGLKEGKTVLNHMQWGKEDRYSIRENRLIDEGVNILCYPADDIALCEYFQDIALEKAYFEEDTAVEEDEIPEDIFFTEDDIKLRDEVAKDIFFFRMSRRASAPIEENAEYAFKAAEAFMKARKNA